MEEQRRIDEDDWLVIRMGQGTEIRVFLDPDRHQLPPRAYISFSGKRMYVADAVSGLETFEDGVGHGRRMISRSEWGEAPDSLVEAVYAALSARLRPPA